MAQPDGISPADWRKLQKALAPLDPKEEKKALTRATKAGAWVTAKAARALAPKDTGHGAKQIKPIRAKSKGFTSYKVGRQQLFATERKVNTLAGSYMSHQDAGYKGEKGDHFIDRAVRATANEALRVTLDAVAGEVEKELRKRAT